MSQAVQEPEPGAAGFGAPPAKSRFIPGPDLVLSVLARGSAILVILMLGGLLVVLTHAALPSIRHFGARFLVSSDWRANPLDQPVMDANGKPVLDSDGEVETETLPPVFGALPVIYGTAVSSALALVFAVPLSLGAALFLVRIAPRRLVAPISFLIEFLAAIPSIAYGIWGLFVLCPFLQHQIEPSLFHLSTHVPGLHWLFWQKSDTGQWQPIALTGRDMFAGGLVLAIMVLPIITAVSRDVLSAVPRAQLEATTALGATWWESAKEMLKFSRSGLFGAVMLGLARAAGETMAVTMVIGNNAQIRASLFAPAQSMASLLANEFGDASSEEQISALLEVALILLVMSLLFNVIARKLVVGKATRASAGH